MFHLSLGRHYNAWFPGKDVEHVHQLFAAYSVIEDNEDHIARVVNGEIVSESESDDPEACWHS